MFPRTRFVREKKIFNRETIQQKNTSVQWNTIQSVKNVVEIYAQQCENVPGVRTSQGRTVLVKNLPRHLRVQSKRWRAQTDPGFTEGLLVQGENSARRQGVLRRDPGRPTVPRELVQSWGTGEGLCSPLRARSRLCACALPRRLTMWPRGRRSAGRKREDQAAL